MESKKTEINIKTASMQIVTVILLKLSELNAFNPGDFEQRYHLFRTLFNEIAQYMPKDDIEKGQEVLDILKEEMNKKISGQPSYFIKLADQFERELRDFAHKKIKDNGEYKLPGYQGV